VNARAIVLLLLAALALPAQAAETTAPPGSALFATLKGLCGATFEGRSVFPTDPKDSFFGKPLVARVASCTETEVRVPFAVGEDRSRTWVFTRGAAGVTLKHDHRHADGTPDAQTDYGGLATAAGSALTQNFAADAYTATLIPAAHSNVWTISLSADGRTLAYILNRDGRLRFESKLLRVDAP
jgi:hypothetical protein